MCRFTYYTGAPISVADLVTQPENSLIHQSTHAQERPEPLNGDGFGVGWYIHDDPVPARFRSLTPAWNNANLAELARVTFSRTIMAHVRAATSGNFDVAQDNCQPFRHGPYAFMHNGHVQSFEKLRRPLMDSLSDANFADIRGNTDSEHLFALAMERLRGHEHDLSCDRLAGALEWAIGRLLGLIATHASGSHAYLNLVLTDGVNAVACRFSTDPDYIDSLYVNEGSQYTCIDGHCEMTQQDGDERAVLISSEPLNPSPRWKAVGRNQVVLVSGDRSVSFRELSVASSDDSSDSGAK